MPKTTKKDFEIFKAECERWIKFFGLYGWRFYFRHGNDDEAINCIAYIVYPINIEDRVFTIGLTENLKETYAEIDIRKSAFHEVAEALMYRFVYLASARYATGEDIQEELHNIVRILENTVWENRTNAGQNQETKRR